MIPKVKTKIEAGFISNSSLTPMAAGTHQGRGYNLTFSKKYSKIPAVSLSVCTTANISYYGFLGDVQVCNLTKTGCTLWVYSTFTANNFGLSYTVIGN